MENRRLMIKKDARTAEYHGCVARNCGQDINKNPYPKDDPENLKWTGGYHFGILEEAVR